MLQEMKPGRPRLRRKPLCVLAVAALGMMIGFGAFLAGTNLWAWYNYKAAKDAIEIGAYQQAEKYLDRCLSFWSGSGQVHFWMARTARSLGKLDKAREHLDKCEELHWSPAAIALETTLLVALQDGFIRVEPTLLKWANEENEDTTAVLEVLAQLYSRNGQVSQALYWGERFLRHSPNNVNALLSMGLIHEVTHNSADALRFYRKAVEIQPDNDRARQALATALLTFHEPREALAHFKELQLRGDESKAIRLGLAQCYRALGRAEEAESLLEGLTADYADAWDVWAEKGKLCLQQTQRVEAEKCLRRSVALNPNEHTTLYSLLLCLRQQGRGKSREAGKLHARYLQLVKDGQRLNTLINRDMSLEPHNAALTFEVATLLTRMGEESSAEHWLHKTLEIRPWHRGARKALAAYYERKAKKAR